MTLFIFATHAEAKASINYLEGTLREPDVFECSEGRIVISGIGLHAAQQAVNRFGRDMHRVWNLGLAGSLTADFSLGALFSIAQVAKYVPMLTSLDPHSKKLVAATLPTFTLPSEGRALISSDFPIHSTYHKEALSPQSDLVDMEGYGIAYSAHHLGLQCSIWKIVSDFSSEGGRTLIQRNMMRYSEVLAQKIADTLTFDLNNQKLI